MTADKHTRIVTTVSVASTMLVAATGAFAWAFAEFTETEGYRYCVPVVVYGTIWALTVVFAAGITWALTEQVGSWMAGPKNPRPTPPPDQPKPSDTPRPAPGPIQPRPPRPPREGVFAVETTLVDMVPVVAQTVEMPKIGIPSMAKRLPDWRPPVSASARLARMPHNPGILDGDQ